VPLINGKPGKEELVKDLSSAPRISLWMTRSGALYYMIPGEGGPNIYGAELSADMKVSKAPVLAIDTFINSNSVPTLSPGGEHMVYASFRDYTAKWTLTPDSSGEKEYTRLQLLDISRTLGQNDQLTAHPQHEFGFPFPR
jgi:hypothetical protein